MDTPATVQPMSMVLPRMVGSTHLKLQGDRVASFTKCRHIAVNQAYIFLHHGRRHRNICTVLPDK